MADSGANGVIVIDKPEGPTSFDVVARLRRVFKTRQIGHTGTLDPMATGVLPICVGAATRIVPFLSEGDKAYEAEVVLGAATDTLDRMGQVVARGPEEGWSREAVEAAMVRFRGTIAQLPPMYSAIRVDGKRLHELARKGIEVEREARNVTIHELTLGHYEAPRLGFTVHCSKGTFVRTLADDLGKALGTFAHLTALRRTRSAGFDLARAVTLDTLERMAPEEASAMLSPIGDALGFLPRIALDATLAQRVRWGQRLGMDELPALKELESGRLCLWCGEEPVSVAEWRDDRLVYQRVFV